MNKLETLLYPLRHKLHSFPELSGKEIKTQKLIVDFLKTHTTCNIKSIANTGVLAIFNNENSNKTILFRADIDALPIHEINNFKHKSKVKVVSHKCGHDGHTAILLGLAKKITDNPINDTSIILLFQPAEEIGKGAALALKDSFFDKIKIDYVFALHNLPGFNKNEIVVKNEEFTSNVLSVIITLKGKTAHASEPENGINPAIALSEIINYSESSNDTDPASDNFFLSTPIYINMGEKAYGISAGYGEIHLTLRSRKTNLMLANKNKLISFLSSLEKKHHLKISTEFIEEFYSNVNNTQAVNIVKKTALKQGFKINPIGTPFKWGEDFGLFTQKYKGAMFGLGAGKDSPNLHNPDYDFPNDIIMTGVNMFYNIIQEINH
ncbi:amidohydrolase [Pseudofulvibacter geojedonensis]|uniref:Amidohydrolase n=1 Tax=Pseudofulvibacter geojedonensis TaxID=1123758 RepID=A0ABW3I0F5_9FLAO